MENYEPRNLMVSRSQTLQPVQLAEPVYETHAEQHFSLQDYLNILIKRKWWMLGVALGSLLLVVLYNTFATPIYRSTTTIQIVQDNPTTVVSERDPLAALASGETLSRFYETQYKLLGSYPLAQRIVEALKLKDNTAFKVLQEGEPKPTPQQVDDTIAEIVMGSLEISPVKNSYLVDVSFTSPDKTLAMTVPNAAYREYLKFSMETRSHSYSLIKEWLQDELNKLAGKVQGSEQNLYEHGKKQDFLSLEGEENVIVKKFVELNRVLTAAQSDRTTKEAHYRQIQEKGVDAPWIINHHLIQNLRGSVIEQQAKVSGFKTVYGVNHPQFLSEQAKLGDLRSRLNAEVQRVLKSVKADYEVALRAENLLQEEVNRQKGKVSELQEHLVQHHILKRDMQTNQQLFDALLVRMKEASVSSTMVATNAALIQPAALPQHPFKPKKMRNLAFALLLGTIGGVGLAFLVEHLDNSLKTVEEVERVCQVPPLGVVPLYLASRKQLPAVEEPKLEILSFQQPRSMLGEAISHLRTSLLLSLSGGPPRTLVFTSANPQEGKTTLTLNMASALAMEHSSRVLVVDTDLRRPRIHQIFDEPSQPGLSNYLTGSATLEEITRSTPIANLYFIPSGPTPPHPVQLLLSPAFKDLVKELREHYHHVLFDVPPTIGFADGRVISQLVDGTILVIRNHQTTREAARLAIQLLYQAQANILGVVMNMAHKGRLGYGGYYEYYKHYSKYYKGYYSE